MKKFIFYFYILLWIVYGLQGTLYAHGSLLSIGSLFVIIAVSLYYLIYSNIHYKLPKPLKILSVLIVIWTIYGLEPILFGSGQTAFTIQPYSYLKNIYMSLLPIYAFFVFTQKGLLTESSLRWLFLVFLVVAISSFYDYQRMALTEVEGNRDEVTNNAGYIIASLIPLLPVFWRKPILQYILLGICLMFVLMGMKRGAVLSGSLCAIWMMISSFSQVEYMGLGKKGRNRFIRLLATVVIVVGAVIAVQYMLATSDYFNQRLSNTIEGNYSGREDMFGSYFRWFVNQDNIINLFFGNGADATLRYLNNYAHNDWLEMLINNGVVVTLLYFAFWVSMISLFLKGGRGTTTHLMLGCFIIIYLIKTLFSMSYNSVTVYAACAIGYAFANYCLKSDGVRKSTSL